MDELKEFKELYPAGSIKSDLVSKKKLGGYIFRTIITPDVPKQPNVFFTGFGEGKKVGKAEIASINQAFRFFHLLDK